MSEIPLGQREGFRLEFKGRDALQNPENIAREVTALLNAEGGEVWVGLREEGGRAVAVEPIPDLEREQRRLRDYLVDTIEPSPDSREVDVQNIEQLLKVEVRKGNRQPYAFLKRGGRHFVIRIGDRVRPMTRQEIQEEFGRAGAVRVSKDQSGLEGAIATVLGERKALQSSGPQGLWLRLQPVPKVELDLQDPRYEEYLLNPRLTENRVVGWTFARFFRRPVLQKDRLITDPEDLSTLSRKVEIRRGGGLVFLLLLEELVHSKGGEREIWPPTLIEYPVSAFRMARRIYEDKLDSQDLVVADLALLGIVGWSLRPRSPQSFRSYEKPRSFTDSTDLVLAEPLVFRFEEVATEPDLCGFRLLERVYEAFGYRREEMPEEFDRKTGRLILPE